MEIIKMYSSVDGENLYTVCFSDPEFRLYSKFKGSRRLAQSDLASGRVKGIVAENVRAYDLPKETIGQTFNKYDTIYGSTAKNGVGKMNLNQKNAFAIGPKNLKPQDVGVNVSDKAFKVERDIHNARAYAKGLNSQNIDPLSKNYKGQYEHRKGLSLEERQRLNELREKRGVKAPNKPSTPKSSAVVSAPKSTPNLQATVPSNTVSESVKNTTKETVAKNKNGMIKKGMNFVKRHKVGVGLGAAGLTAAGVTGAYLYNKNKKNQG